MIRARAKLPKKYVQFEEDPSKAKTRNIAVNSADGTFWLGQIKWFGRWRRYAFFPAPEMVFDVYCLNEIIAKINELMAERKK